MQGADAPSGLARRVLGARVDALLEIVAFLALTLLIDRLWGLGDQFAQVVPHPFWIAVLLAASYYGTREGLTAAVLASVALIAGVLHALGSHSALQSWTLPVVWQPVAWIIAAVILGEIRDAWRRRNNALQEEVDELREHTRAITAAYERVQQEKGHLEARVAGQLLTVYAMYNASRAIEKQGVGEVLMGVGELVRTVLAPEKFSLFLLSGAKLEAALSEGWAPDDTFERELEESSPLFRAIVFDRRLLVIVKPADEPILRPEGVLAGPVVDRDTDQVIGMLKIEALRFLDLHPSNVQNFGTLCEWIGAALTSAQQIERLRQVA
jgi:hypothetical protein